MKLKLNEFTKEEEQHIRNFGVDDDFLLEIEIRERQILDAIFKERRIKMGELPKIKIAEKTFYIDKRFSRIREVNNPYNWSPVSLEILNYWIDNNIKEINR